MRRLWLAAALLCLAACGTSAPAYRHQVELLSWTEGFINELGTPTEGSLQNVDASLMLPASRHKGQKVPAIVLLHSGVGQGTQDWFYAKLLNSWGVAVLAIDSFSPRHVKNTVGDQEAVSEASILEDAYAGLNYLSRDPRIDRKHIAVMGFSKGAAPALLAALEHYRVRLAQDGNRFAAHIAYYPWCGFAFINHRTTGSPILVMSGADDSITPAALCEKLTDRWSMTNPNTDIQMIVYPNAGHAFEYPNAFLELVGTLPVIGQIPRNCFIAEVEPGQFIETRSRIKVTGKTIRDALKVCATWSSDGQVEFNAEAQADSRRRLHEFVERTLLTQPQQQATVGSSN